LILELTPRDAEAYFYLAYIADETKNRSAAQLHLKKALEFNPDYAEALNFLGYIYVEENQNLDKAEALIKKALEIEPGNGAYMDSLGWLYFKKGKISEAEQELEKATGVLDDPVIFDHLGDVYFKTGAADKAKQAWKKSLELDQTQEKVKKKLEKLEKSKR